MKKSALQKPIKEILLGKGFERINPNDYAITAGDGSTKLILRIPDGKKGFILAVQFADFGVFDGVFANAVMRQYDFAYVMAYGDIKEYSESEMNMFSDRGSIPLASTRKKHRLCRCFFQLNPPLRVGEIVFDDEIQLRWVKFASTASGWI